jgi:uncharacterized membrane-anchored protein YhcB (DUF1043 family)
MDPLFWILAGVVVGCVIGIIIIWRLEVRAERRAADTRKVEAEVSARLKIFDPRRAMEEVDTRPIPAAPPDAQEASAREAPSLRAPVARPSWAAEPEPPIGQPGDPADSPADAPAMEVDILPLPAFPLYPTPLPAEAEAQKAGAQPMPAISPQPSPVPAAQEVQTVPSNGKDERQPPPDVLPTTPELASVRAAELGRERRYLEQAIEEQQARLAQLLHIQMSLGAPETATIRQLRDELAEQRGRLEEIIAQEERYRQAAVPSLEQLAQDYKNAASPHTPRAFGVRRHSLAPFDLPDKHPPAPPTQAKPDASS